MVEKPYKWAEGASLGEHSKRKHKILKEYFRHYLLTRCQHPRQSRFRLAIVDGFAGGGSYSCGAVGSPIIFLDILHRTLCELNVHRAAQGAAKLEIECLIVLNDYNRDAMESLRELIAPRLVEMRDSAPELHINVQYINEKFEDTYPDIKRDIVEKRFRNVVFNLDQCGHSHVERNTIVDIINSFSSPEIFYTFAIEALLNFLQKSDPKALAMQLSHLGLHAPELDKLKGMMNTQVWLGTAEQIVFNAFRSCAPFVSPFSIHNPEGWRYWLIHFAKPYIARQVYNDVLHNNSSTQAHFGRSGLHMLAYNPDHSENLLYLFDETGRETSKHQLMDDIPRLIADSGDAISVSEFYSSIYNMTPAKTSEIHSVVIEHPDLEVITESGGERRKASSIIISDTIRLRTQPSFFPMFRRKG